MARMHSGKKGKSGSTQPPTDVVPAWVTYKAGEVKELVVNLANAGHSASEIGMILRDQYGIPNVKAIVGKTITRILGENKILGEIPEDLMNLIRTSVKLQKHMEKNKKDMTAKRGFQLSVSKIRRLAKYYTKKGKLPGDWRYSEETAALLVK